MKELICTQCGTNMVSVDATATWVVKTQSYEVLDVYGDGDRCTICGKTQTKHVQLYATPDKIVTRCDECPVRERLGHKHDYYCPDAKRVLTPCYPHPGEIHEDCPHLIKYPGSLLHAYITWNLLGDVPVNNGNLDAPFAIFEKGYDLDEVWHWFEETFNLSIGKIFDKSFTFPSKIKGLAATII